MFNSCGPGCATIHVHASMAHQGHFAAEDYRRTLAYTSWLETLSLRELRQPRRLVCDIQVRCLQPGVALYL